VGAAKHYTQLIGEADSGNRVELVIASRSLFLRLGLVTWRCANSRLSIALQTSFIRSLVTDVVRQLLPKVTRITRQISQRRKAPMSSTLSSTRSWVSADPTKSSVDATLVPADPTIATGPKNEWASIKWPLLDRRTSRAIVFLITFCIGVAAFLAWQSSREMTASAPQTARVAPSPNLEQQLEAISLGLTTLRQSVDQLAASLGQMRNDITNLQTAQQVIFEKVSEPAPRPAAAAAPTPKATPRPSQAPPVR
jgi:hypothetical protein